MHDTQSQSDDREVPLDQVGVSDLRYPISVLDRDRGKQETVANLSLSVALPHHHNGDECATCLLLAGHTVRHCISFDSYLASPSLQLCHC